MSSMRIDLWIKSATSVDPFSEFMGKHLEAHPFGLARDAFGGQLIGLSPDAETASLRRYDTGEIREFPWFTTNFKVPAHIESPFTELAVGMIRRFELFEDTDGSPLKVPRSLLGTVDKVTPEAVDLWVRDRSFPIGGWWLHIKADDAAKYSLRPPVSVKPSE